MNRRDFFVRVGGVALVAPAAVKLAACGDDGGDTDIPDAAPPQAMCGVEIGTNHPGGEHSLDLSVADVMAGAEKTYDIQGESAHPHTITVTGADFQMLQKGSSIMITSSSDAAHTHLVTITCMNL